MVILQLISSEGYYGAENMVVSLARALERLGNRCMVAAFRDSRFMHSEVVEEAQRQGLKGEVVPCRGRLDWSTIRGIRRLLLGSEIDILHTHGYKADLYGFVAAKRGRTVLVATCHNWPSKRLIMRGYATLDRLALRRFGVVAAVSWTVANRLKDSGVSEPFTIDNGVEVQRFVDAEPTLVHEVGNGVRRLVGFIGRLVPDKGGAHLLRAAQRVLAAHPGTKFVFVGDGPAQRDWEALADQLGIRDSVMFVGKREDMPGVYASLDVVVLPSLVEAMPMSLLEALAAHRPVVATRVGSVSRVIAHGRTGLLVEPGDADGLAEGICLLLGNSDVARRLGDEGHAHVAEHFSADAMARAYQRLYVEALERLRG